MNYLDSITKKKILEVGYDDSFDGIHANWFGLLNSRKEALNAFQMIIDYVASHKVDRLINENTHLNGNWPVDQHDVDAWMNKLKILQLEKLAHVTSSSLMAKQSSEMLSKATFGIQVRYFDDLAHAKSWMLS